jgi:hypothetical protein
LRFRRGHLHEAEAARSAGLAVVDEFDGINLPVTLEEHPEVGFIGGERQVAYIDRGHSRFP